MKNLNHYNQRWVMLFTRKSSTWAITIFQHTFYSVSKNKVTEQWRRHEDAHKAQQAKEPFQFYPKYLYYLVKYGYTKNPYEVAAREAEK